MSFGKRHIAKPEIQAPTETRTLTLSTGGSLGKQMC